MVDTGGFCLDGRLNMLRCAVALRGAYLVRYGLLFGDPDVEAEPVVLRGPEVKGGTGCF